MGWDGGPLGLLPELCLCPHPLAHTTPPQALPRGPCSQRPGSPPKATDPSCFPNLWTQNYPEATGSWETRAPSGGPRTEPEAGFLLLQQLDQLPPDVPGAGGGAETRPFLPPVIPPIYGRSEP